MERRKRGKMSQRKGRRDKETEVRETEGRRRGGGVGRGGGRERGKGGERAASNDKHLKIDTTYLSP